MQAIAKTGGPTTPNFNRVNGQATKYCSLLDINGAPDTDANGDGVADPTSVTLVGRMPRQIPGTSNWICAIAPAGGVVSVIPGALTNPNGLMYQYQATNANFYQACANGRYLYKLGGISNPGDAATDSCAACPRGSFATPGGFGVQLAVADFLLLRVSQRCTRCLGLWCWLSAAGGPEHLGCCLLHHHDHVARPISHMTAPHQTAPLTTLYMGSPQPPLNPTGATFCQACAPNSYQSNTGQRACSPCQYGYANLAGSVRCMNCYYGRPYCSEGYTPDATQFSCNANRMPDNPVPYDPQDGK